MLVNREFKRLGDLVAQTVVVYRDEARAAVAIPPAPPAPPAAPLSVQEARVILDCAERVPEFGEGTGSARERLLRVANHLVGRTR
jgi:hypothetical protein